MPRKSQIADSKRRTPRQARARHTVDVILEATALILEHEGKGAVNTNRIAERAGVAINTVYQYFRNKEAILVEVARREMERHRGDVVSAISTPLPSESAELDRVAIHALIQGSSRRHRARRLAMETLIAQGLSAEAAGPTDEVGRALNQNAARLAPSLKQPLSPVALFVLTRAVQGVIGAGLREESPFYRTLEFEDELLRLVRGYFAQLTDAPAATP